ncbi:MAG: methyltransferase domain-containing protein [Eggerthellaceae bacterium]|nr:methyltransferase domain-containing protein [Eggerthellaceae bacterium]
MDYKAWYTLDVDPVEYYAQIAATAPLDPQETARTRDADGTMPVEAAGKLFNISAEIKNLFHEFGAPMPPLMEGCTVLDLCCGSGRDTYLAAQLVGQEGKVIGVEPNAKRLAVAEKYFDQEMKQFGYDEPNVELHVGVPEDLSFVPDASVDIVISNCTFNLSPDKEKYVREVFRVLKDNGEWYFTDVFTARRVPEELAKKAENRVDRLAGAMYVGDFRRLVQANGFNDPRYLMNWKTPLSNDERVKYGEVEFATLTVRVLKSEWTEDVCESYGETVTYDGSLPGFSDYFLFEWNIKFPTGKDCVVCGNVSGLAQHSRYAKVFKVVGDRSAHVGDTHHAFDALVVNAPDFENVRDEDDQPIQASCC